jgi:glycogen operon protein
MVLDGGIIPDRNESGERISDDTLAVLLHSSAEDCQWRLPPGTWEVILDTAAPDEEPGTRILRRGTSLTVAARSVVVLRRAPARR